MASRVTRLWRESATLMIVSRNVVKERNGIFDYKVLMLQRSPKSRFMPGNYVFPGGVIDSADFDDGWMDLFHKSFQTFGSDFSSLLDIKGPRPPIFKQSKSIIPSEVAFRICAIRETFEESGVLLLKKISGDSSVQPLASNGCVAVEEGLSFQEISKWRSDVHKDATRFIELCRELDSVPDVWSLTEWSNWLTPADMKIRFDAAFFICFCDHQPTAQHDEKETVHSQWKTPAECLNDFFSKKYKVGFPQLYTLLQLCRMPKWNELKDFQKDRSKDGITRVIPIRVMSRDSTNISIFPGDDMYPKLLEHLAQVTNGEYGIRGGAVPIQELQETCQELEENIVNFNRIIFTKSTGSYKLKVNCSVGNRTPIPLTDTDQFVAWGDTNAKL